MAVRIIITNLKSVRNRNSFNSAKILKNFHEDRIISK